MTFNNALQSFTRAERQAAIAASKDPLVRRAAREPDSKVSDGGIDPGAVAGAERLLAAAVADALAVLAPEAPEKVSDFAMQAALFAVGAHVFIAPPDTDMAGWIASMPDEALDGLRNSMVETARAMGRHEDAARIANEPKETLASILAESAPKAASGVIADLDAFVAIVEESEPLDPQGEAARLLSADAAGAKVRDLRGIAARQARLLRRLRKYSFPAVAVLLSGLLTRPENHTATARIEALLHLAALACRGRKKPGLQQLREWLTEIDEDPIAKLEIPIEDVFVSNVEASFGNARLFQGRWENNAEYVRACTETLLRIGEERPWAREALGHIMALLRLSEALAERAGAERYTRTESTPGEKIVLRDSAVKESSRHVVFSDEDLAAIGVGPGALYPFVIQNEHAGSLAGQTMGHPALERRPLVRLKGCTTVAVPTAIGTAVRRFAIEQAAAAGDLRPFQSTWHLAQFSEAFLLGRPGWGVGYIEMSEPDPDDGMREFIGTFDESGYVHLVFVPDDFEAAGEAGLASIRPLEEAVCKRIRERASALASRQDYRRGLTVLVHGGVGRRFSPTLEDLPDFPPGWQRLCVSASDFMLLGSMPDFTALRAWKLLQQVDELKERGILLPNLRGFLNLVAFAYWVGFELAPENMSAGTLYLHSDFLQDLALHREFAHLGLEPGVLLVPLIRRAGFERRLAPAKERLAPGGKPSRCRAQLAAERLQALAPQKTQDRLPLPMRHKVRTALDRHAARAPDGDSWVSIQRQPAGGHFDEIQGREEYFSPGHMAHGEVLACVESASRLWWVYISDGIPEERWPRAIVFTRISHLGHKIGQTERRFFM